MSASKPMTFLCLECVLQNMDANLRFRIIQRCPKIRSIEKRVPLHIKSLDLSEYHFYVNDTSYRLGIIQEYPDELMVPDAVKIWNNRGGVQEDLNEYGTKIYSVPPELAPGDIEIKKGHPKRNAVVSPVLADGEQPTLRLSAQLTVSGYQLRGFYRGSLTTLPRIMKSIYKFFFGNRKHPITIGTLFVGRVNSDAVLRLPENLKIKISNLVFTKKSRKVWRALTPIIYESSFPLQHVESDFMCWNPQTTTARSLKITVERSRYAPTREYFLNLECEKLQVVNPLWGAHLTVVDFTALIEQWLETGREEGTCYEVEMKIADLDILKEIINVLDGEYKDRKGKIPMNDFGLELHLGFRIGAKIIFKMEVIQRNL
ncbi:unnamed protein product [Caenorhabditis brenneri]